MDTGGPPYDHRILKEMLQSTVQSVQWTYIIFWKLCPQQRVLVWGDGYYNGSIKTRKTVQSVEVSTEEAALSRSEQLRELYDSLASGEQQLPENQPVVIRRPSVALSPEDLTESEWFYLMCVSFSFPPGVGLVGEAYAKQQHLWLTSADEVDSTVFSKVILAKSAHIKTVICIPLLNGVVELGTTKKVKETTDFIQHVKLFFTIDNDNLILPPPKPTLLGTLSPHQMPTTIESPDNAYSMDEHIENEDEEEENVPDFVAETYHFSSFQEPNYKVKTAMDTFMEANELLQLDMSEDIRFGSPNDSSSNLNSRFNLLVTSNDESCRAESTPGWSHNLELLNPSTTQLQAQGILAQEDTHYSHTVSTILHNQLNHKPSHQQNTVYYSTQSSFATWTSNHHKSHHFPSALNSQQLLKSMLFTVPFLHTNNKSATGDTSESVAPKTTSHDDLSGSHVLAERRRREKLNERFIILRSLVPLVTKTDKASILGDTIEYVKQLRKKVQDLEACGCHDVLDGLKVAEKRKIQVVEGGSGGRGGGDGGRKVKAMAVQVEVSIIESDALVEMQCKNREGLLLDVMKKLRELGLEVMTIQSCVDGGMCTAEIRAKVKGNNGKKISIMQVKKAINQMIYP